MSSPYIPNVDSDRREMLEGIGVSAVDDLFHDVPGKYRNVQFNLPGPFSEFELRERLNRMSLMNADADSYACFLGAGYYNHFIPGVIGHITGRSEF